MGDISINKSGGVHEPSADKTVPDNTPSSGNYIPSNSVEYVVLTIKANLHHLYQVFTGSGSVYPEIALSEAKGVLGLMENFNNTVLIPPGGTVPTDLLSSESGLETTTNNLNILITSLEKSPPDIEEATKAIETANSTFVVNSDCHYDWNDAASPDKYGKIQMFSCLGIVMKTKMESLISEYKSGTLSPTDTVKDLYQVYEQTFLPMSSTPGLDKTTEKTCKIMDQLGGFLSMFTATGAPNATLDISDASTKALFDHFVTGGAFTNILSEATNRQMQDNNDLLIPKDFAPQKVDLPTPGSASTIEGPYGQSGPPYTGFNGLYYWIDNNKKTTPPPSPPDKMLESFAESFLLGFPFSKITQDDDVNARSLLKNYVNIFSLTLSSSTTPADYFTDTVWSELGQMVKDLNHLYN
ncbi:MAG: hypothetical protein MRY21_07505 [Simkaniaceae bacterium]|nr:hypothetical protein [Simkaniaceae bacterium]